MKTKSFRKKLKLNKKTIANLGTDKMGRIKGGESEAGITIPPCATDTCVTDTCPTVTCPAYSCKVCESVPAYLTCTCIPTFEFC